MRRLKFSERGFSLQSRRCSSSESRYQILQDRQRRIIARLKAASTARDLDAGRIAHGDAIASGIDSNSYVACSLVSMYAKCGSMTEARKIFEGIPSTKRDVVPWNALVLGYAENGQGQAALEMFSRMESHGCEPNGLMFVGVLKACSALAGNETGILVDGKVVKMESLRIGMGIHARVSRRRCLDADIKLPNTLIDMYAKCGSLRDAFLVFEGMPCHSIISWTVLLLACVDNDEQELALELFHTMTKTTMLEPDDRAFLAAVRACVALAEEESGVEIDRRVFKLQALVRGMEVHARARRSGYDTDAFVANSLVDLYAKCGSMVASRRIFERMARHDVICWTSLMLGYVDDDDPDLALAMFETMNGLAPTPLSFVAAFKACAALAAGQGEDFVAGGKPVVKLEVLERGRAIHSRARREGFDSEILVANTLVSMYANFGSMTDARRAFDRSEQRDRVLWTSLLVGYVQNGEGSQALEIFVAMKEEAGGLNFAGDPRTYCAALKACGCSAGLGLATAIHAEVCRHWRLEDDPVLATTLLDAYGKCGSMVDSQLVFDSLPVTDSVAWTALLAGYGGVGDTGIVFEVFERMSDEGVELNEVTFRCAFTACSHAGLVRRAEFLFERMQSKFGIAPRIEHFVCMIDLLSRANELDAAVAMLRSMPFKPNVVSWMVILAGCKKWKNVEIGKIAFESLLELDRENPAAYELMSHIYKIHS